MKTITVEMLRSKGACERGLTAFAEVFPNGMSNRRWLPSLFMFCAKRFGPHFWWAVRNDLVPIPDISTVLRSADMLRVERSQTIKEAKCAG